MNRYWPDLAAKVAAVCGDELDFDAWRKAKDAAESDWDEIAAGVEDEVMA